MELVENGHGVAILEAGDVVALCYPETPTVRTAGVVESYCAKYLAAPRRSIGVLVVIETRTPAPEAAARDAIARIMKRYERQVVALAQVALGTGFGAAAMRAALAGMNLVARPAYPTHVFADLVPALDWLAQCGAAAPEGASAIAGELRAAMSRAA